MNRWSMQHSWKSRGRRIVGALAGLLTCFVVVMATATTAAAQGGPRAALLRQATAAYDDFDVARATRLARAALDPSLGARDSVWTRGVHLLTQLLIEADQAPQARLWARWALRLEPTLAIDSVNFLGRVVTTLRAARDSSVRTAGDAVTRETYTWPAVTATTAETRLRLAASDVPLRVLVRGQGVLATGAGLVLEPGVYELEVSAPGFLPLKLMREVLPGITTELAFTLPPAAAAAETLDDAVRTRVTAGLVTLSVQRFGTAARCAVGAVVAPGGVIAAAYDAIRGADSVSLAGGGALRVAAWDRNANVALLAASGLETAPLAGTPLPVDGQALFGFGRSGCEAWQDARALIAAASPSALTLSAAPATLPIGAPMVDYEGRLAGFYAGGTTVTPLRAVTPLLPTAAVALDSNRTRTAREVATQEQQRYGVLQLTAPMRGASLRVEPLEPWHWAALDTTGASPLTFAGPQGRYRVHVLVTGAGAQTQDVTVLAGQRRNTTLAPRPVAVTGGRAPAQANGRKIPRWVWYAALGAGALAGVALGGGGGGDAGPSVVISVPNP